MKTATTMTAGMLSPGDRVLDNEDGDLFVIDAIERIDHNQLALVDAGADVLVIDADEIMFLDAVLPRVWRYKADAYGATVIRQVEHVAIGETVTLPWGGKVEVMGLMVIGNSVTLYERGEPAATLDRGTPIEVDR